MPIKSAIYGYNTNNEQILIKCIYQDQSERPTSFAARNSNRGNTKWRSK